MILFLEIILPIVISWVVCVKKSRKRKKSIVDKIENGIVRVKREGKITFIGGFKVIDMDSVRLYNGFYETMRQYTRLLHKSSSNVILQVHLFKKPIDKRSLLNKLEREITSLRIVKMSDPTNIRIDNKLKVLENLYKVISEGSPPVALSVEYVFCSSDLTALKSEIQYVRSALEELFGAQVAPLGVSELLKRCDVRMMGIKSIITPSEALALTPVSMVNPRLDGVYIGTDTDAQPFLIPKDDLLKHIIVVGATGTGKTSFLATLALRVQELLNVDEIVVVDPKGDLDHYLSLLGINAKVYRFRGDPNRRKVEVKEYVDSVVRQIIERRPTNELTTMVMVDEAWLVGSDILEELVREGRSKGVAVVLASQSLNDFDKSIRVNVHTKIAFRLNEVDEESCKTFEEKCGFLDKLPRGEALVRTTYDEILRINVDVRELLQALTSNTLKSSSPSSRSISSTSFFNSPSTSTKT